MSIPEIIDWNLKNIFSKWAPNKTNRILFHKNNLDETKKISKKLHPAHEHELRSAQVRLLGSLPKLLVQYLSWVEKQLWWLRCKLFWVVLWRCVMTNSLNEKLYRVVILVVLIKMSQSGIQTEFCLTFLMQRQLKLV